MIRMAVAPRFTAARWARARDYDHFRPHGHRDKTFEYLAQAALLPPAPAGASPESGIQTGAGRRGLFPHAAPARRQRIRWSRIAESDRYLHLLRKCYPLPENETVNVTCARRW